MKHVAASLLAATFAFALLAGTASATVVLHKSVEALTQESRLVLHGVVTGQRSGFARDKNTIHTWTTIQVMEYLKGEKAAPKELVIRQIGGSAEGLTQMLPGDASFEIGQEVVVFLNPNETGRPVWHLSALAQAKFDVRVMRDPKTGQTQRMARPDPQVFDLVYMQREADGSLGPAPKMRAIDMVPLTHLFDRIRKSL